MENHRIVLPRELWREGRKEGRKAETWEEAETQRKDKGGEE